MYHQEPIEQHFFLTKLSTIELSSLATFTFLMNMPLKRSL